MSFYVACPCGQAFQARADLAGSTLACPACGRPLVVPVPTAAAPVILQPHRSDLPAKSSIPTSIIIAATATGAVAVVLIVVVVFQQFADRPPETATNPSGAGSRPIGVAPTVPLPEPVATSAPVADQATRVNAASSGADAIHLDTTISLISLKARFAFRSDCYRKTGEPNSSLLESYRYRTPDGGLLSFVVQEHHSPDVQNYDGQLKACQEWVGRGDATLARGGLHGKFRMIETRSKTNNETTLRRFVFVGTKVVDLIVLTSPSISDTSAERFFGSLQIDEPPPSLVASDQRQPAESEPHPNAHLAAAFQKKIVLKTSGGWVELKSHTGRCTFEMPEDAHQAVNVNDPGRSAEVFRYPLNLVDEEGKLAVNVTVTTANVREPIDRKFAQMEEAAKRNKDLKVETTSFGGYPMKQWTMEAPRYRMERVIFLDTNSFIIMTAEAGTKVDRAMIERFLRSIKL